MRAVTATHRGLARVMLAAVVVQFYFAGLAAFGVADFAAHAVTGWALMPASLGLLVLAAVARSGGRTLALSALVLACVVLQPVLAFVPRATLPAISAVHPVNGLVIAALLYALSRGSRER